jgi:hypothetical protein
MNSNPLVDQQDISRIILMFSPIETVVSARRVSKFLHKIATEEVLPQLSSDYQKIFFYANKFKFTMQPAFNNLKLLSIPAVITVLCNYSVSVKIPRHLGDGVDAYIAVRESIKNATLEDFLIESYTTTLLDVQNKIEQMIKNPNIIEEEVDECKKYLNEGSELFNDKDIFSFFESSIAKRQKINIKLACQSIETNQSSIDHARLYIHTALNQLPFKNKHNYHALIEVAKFIYKDVFIPAMSRLLEAQGTILNTISDEQEGPVTEFKPINEVIFKNILDLHCDNNDLIELQNKVQRVLEGGMYGMEEAMAFRTFNKIVIENQLSDCSFFTMKQGYEDIKKYRESELLAIAPTDDLA